MYAKPSGVVPGFFIFRAEWYFALSVEPHLGQAIGCTSTFSNADCDSSGFVSGTVFVSLAGLRGDVF